MIADRGSTAFQLLFNQMTDNEGRQCLFLGSTLFLALGSGICGGLTLLGLLIGERIVQGAGVDGTYFEPIMDVTVVAVVTWRWSFYVGISIGAAGLMVIAMSYKLKPVTHSTLKENGSKTDFLVEVIFVSSVTAILSPLSTPMPSSHDPLGRDLCHGHRSFLKLVHPWHSNIH